MPQISNLLLSIFVLCFFSITMCNGPERSLGWGCWVVDDELYSLTHSLSPPLLSFVCLFNSDTPTAPAPYWQLQCENILRRPSKVLHTLLWQYLRFSQAILNTWLRLASVRYLAWIRHNFNGKANSLLVPLVNINHYVILKCIVSKLTTFLPI